ncbi:MAG: DTW domain-containing protein [Acidobacteria bacterium]|nr:DTW domain-containing protein [Acidobacteriota bacterium]
MRTSTPRPRPFCYRCRRPAATCVCAAINPLATRTHLVFLTHPKEYRKVRVATGRLAHLSLEGSELLVGTEFDQHPRVTRLLDDPAMDCRLVYPGPDVENLSRGEYRPRPGLQPVFVLIDGSWSTAQAILRRSQRVAALPRVGFDTTTPSEFVIKRQPRPECLCTLEAAHRCLTLLTAQGHEDIDATQGRRLLAPLRRLIAMQGAYPGRLAARRPAIRGVRTSDRRDIPCG